MQLSDLQVITILGAGGFGKVSLVSYRGKHYALKQMTKAHIVDHHLTTHVHREKKCMLECESPWLVNLVATLKDAKNIYMLMEVVLGGELFAYLQVGERSVCGGGEGGVGPGRVVRGLRWGLQACNGVHRPGMGFRARVWCY